MQLRTGANGVTVLSFVNHIIYSDKEQALKDLTVYVDGNYPLTIDGEKVRYTDERGTSSLLYLQELTDYV